MKKHVELNKKDSAQILVIVALMMVVIVGAATLAIDVGSMSLTKAELQSGVDAAALAGAMYLPDDLTRARTTATEYAAKNGIVAGNGYTLDITFKNSNKSITVAASLTSPTFFARILGTNTTAISANATASLGIANSVPWIVPFVIPRPPNFNYDTVYVLRMYGKGDYQAYPSTGYPNNYKYPYSWTTDADFSPYTLSNRYLYTFDYMNVHIVPRTGFTDYIEWLTNGYHETFSVADIMTYYAPSTGAKQSVDALASRVTRDPNTDYTQAKIGDARVILIPVVESMKPRNTPDGTNMTIIGFVGFYIQNVYKVYRSSSPTDYCMDVNGSRITTGYGTCYWFEGRFLEDLVIGTGEVTYDPNADFGLRVIGLTE